MSDTPKLALPLLASAQAQKHVTVNEALTRLDAIAQAGVLSASVSSPPAAVDGDAYIVGPAAGGAWTGREGAVAFFVNGGWDFAAPNAGWRVWAADQGDVLTWVGDRWAPGLAGGFALGAHARIQVLTADATLSGASVTTALTIPDRAVVFAVTARVLSAVSGAGVSGWRVGVAGAADRYGAGIGLVKDSASNGITGAPVGYFADTPLIIEAEGGAFDGGEIRLAAHFITFIPPDAV